MVSSSKDNGLPIFTEDEKEVADMLLDLPFMITKSISSYRFSYDWGVKKRRSALVSPPPYSPPRCPRKLSAPPPSKAEASSPNTPLSFSPSESDCKSKLSFKRKKAPALILRKKELEESVKERELTQNQLKESIEKVNEYLNSLIAENSELKAKKQKLLMPACTTTQMEQQQQQQTTTGVNDQVHAVPSTSTVYHHQASLISSHQQNGGVNNQIHAGPSTSTDYYHHQAPLSSHHQQFHQLNGAKDWVPAGPSTSNQYHRHQAPLISHQFHQLNSGKNWVHAGPSTSTQFHQYYQATPFINHHHHHHHQAAMVNDSVRAILPSPMQIHYLPPLIPRHEIGSMINDENPFEKGVRFDLNMEPDSGEAMDPDSGEAKDQTFRARRAARHQANKEKRPRQRVLDNGKENNN